MTPCDPGRVTVKQPETDKPPLLERDPALVARASMFSARSGSHYHGNTAHSPPENIACICKPSDAKKRLLTGKNRNIRAARRLDRPSHTLRDTACAKRSARDFFRQRFFSHCKSHNLFTKEEMRKLIARNLRDNTAMYRTKSTGAFNDTTAVQAKETQEAAGGRQQYQLSDEAVVGWNPSTGTVWYNSRTPHATHGLCARIEVFGPHVQRLMCVSQGKWVQ